MSNSQYTPEFLAQTQRDLEEESLVCGQRKYYERLSKTVAAKREFTTRPIMSLIQDLSGLLSTAIDAQINLVSKTHGRQIAGLGLLREIGLEPDALALITLRRAMSSISSEPAYSTIAISIAEAVREEMAFRRFKDSDRTAYEITQRHIDSMKTPMQRRKAVRHMTRKTGIEWLTWDDTQKVAVGSWLLEQLLLIGKDFFRTRLLNTGVNKTRRVLLPTDTLIDWMNKAHDRMSLMCPTRLPMVVAPRDWSGPTGGGYLTTAGGVVHLIKTRNTEYLKTLNQVDLGPLLEALNALQGTSYAINTAVLSVAEECWERGMAIGSMPSPDKTPLPAQPAGWEGRMHELKKADFEAYKGWAVRAAAVHDENESAVSKRMAAAEKLTIARRFAEYPEVFFPHVIDFRGRAYPVPTHLNPQGDDLAKSLLRFSEGKPITERGIWWLKVHIANCFGVDKVSFAERVAWTDSHFEQLVDSGLSPMDGMSFWMEAEDKWSALAACFELAGVALQGEEFVTHLSIPMDGSCNGLQNFSALLLDPIGAKATNLVPSEIPADIYTEVAKLVEAQVAADADGGNLIALIWQGNIGRKIVKQPVMTLPYGATIAGMRSQIEQALKKNHPGLFQRKDVWAACGYLADVVYNAIGQVVVAAVAAMDWLRAVAKVAASESYPIRWTSPIGLPVLQDYRETTGKQVQIHVDGKKQKIILAIEGDKLNKRRQQAGISPNLIHSFDAAHMMRTVLVAKDNGINSFAAIHDSYGTHACDVDLMHQCIREAFIQQYSTNLLQKFRDELVEQLPEEVGRELPPIPESGNLDLNAVRDSLYFFS